MLAGYEIRLNAHGMLANNLHDSIEYKKQIPSQHKWYEDQRLMNIENKLVNEMRFSVFLCNIARNVCDVSRLRK